MRDLKISLDICFLVMGKTSKADIAIIVEPSSDLYEKIFDQKDNNGNRLTGVYNINKDVIEKHLQANLWMDDITISRVKKVSQVLDHEPQQAKSK